MAKKYLTAGAALIAIMALLGCSNSDVSSGVSLAKVASTTVHLRVLGGAGAIQVYDDSKPIRYTNRLSVAQGQCTGPASCITSINVAAGTTLHVVASAKKISGTQWFNNLLHYCESAVRGCNTGRTAINLNATTSKTHHAFKLVASGTAMSIESYFSSNDFRND
jgi:hypothetical protein